MAPRLPPEPPHRRAPVLVAALVGRVLPLLVQQVQLQLIVSHGHVPLRVLRVDRSQPVPVRVPLGLLLPPGPRPLATQLGADLPHHLAGGWVALPASVQVAHGVLDCQRRKGVHGLAPAGYPGVIHLQAWPQLSHHLGAIFPLRIRHPVAPVALPWLSAAGARPPAAAAYPAIHPPPPLPHAARALSRN